MIKIHVFDKKANRLVEKEVDSEHKAGFAVETYLRRFDTELILIRKVK